MPTDSSRASSQSSELQLALPALPPSTTISRTTLDMRTINQSTSVANMVILSKEIASAAPIVNPGIVCWNATGHAFQDPCHFRSSVCQIDNLTPSSKTFVRKYTSTRAFQIQIKLRAIKAHSLISTGAQCSVLSSGLVKHASDKALLQLPICDVKLPLKVITSVRPQTEMFLNAVNDNVLEEIPEEERASFYDDKSDIFSQPKEIEAEQPIWQGQPSPDQSPQWRLEVTKLAEPIFLVPQVSVSILPHCQQWVNSTVFPTTTQPSQM
uniref:Uncharacterized protein n=1 Tax=Romanomermis culicivorax TaxID=13658 RepID=A0A915J4M1_ROMCU